MCHRPTIPTGPRLRVLASVYPRITVLSGHEGRTEAQIWQLVYCCTRATCTQVNTKNDLSSGIGRKNLIQW